MRRSTRITAVVLAISTLAAACGSDDSTSDDQAVDATESTAGETDDASAPPSSESDEESSTSSSEEPPTAAAPGGTLRFGYDIALSRFDPHRSTLSQDGVTLFPTYDRLVHQDPDGNAVPGLATEWSFSDDGLTLSFVLREGVTFHDGEAFNAEAVKANIERAQTVEGGSHAGDLEVIESINVVSDNEVEMVLSGPAPQLPLVLSDRAGAMISPAAFDNDDLDLQPVGAGMYTVTEYVPGDRVVYERYDDYWDPDAAALDSLEIRIVADPTTRLNAIRSGELDWTTVAESDFETVSALDDLDVELFSTISYSNLPMKRSGVLADAKVRQALNYGIDRESILQALFGGLGKPCLQPFPEDYFAFNEEVGCDSYPYDPEMANSLLAEAGYADGFDIELLFGTSGNTQQVAEVVQSQLAELNINVTLRQVETGQIGDIWLAQKESDMLVGSWGGRPDPLQTLFLQYHPEGFANTGDHVNEEFVETYNAAIAEPDEAARTELIQEMSGIVTRDALDLVLWYREIPNVLKPEVQGAERYLSGKQEFRGVTVAS